MILAFLTSTASDAPMSDSELKAAGGDVLHIPTVAGSVAIVNNAGLDNLKLDGETLAAIYLGDIKKWNDSKIAELNPGLNLPDKSIKVVYRSDASGNGLTLTANGSVGSGSGIINDGALFTNSGEYLSSSSSSLSFHAHDFTLSAWINFSSRASSCQYPVAASNSGIVSIDSVLDGLRINGDDVELSIIRFFVGTQLLIEMDFDLFGGFIGHGIG